MRYRRGDPIAILSAMKTISLPDLRVTKKVLLNTPSKEMAVSALHSGKVGELQGKGRVILDAGYVLPPRFPTSACLH